MAHVFCERLDECRYLVLSTYLHSCKPALPMKLGVVLSALCGVAWLNAATSQSSGVLTIPSDAEVSTGSRSIPPRGCTCLDTRDRFVYQRFATVTPCTHEASCVLLAQSMCQVRVLLHMRLNSGAV